VLRSLSLMPSSLQAHKQIQNPALNLSIKTQHSIQSRTQCLCPLTMQTGCAYCKGICSALLYQIPDCFTPGIVPTPATTAQSQRPGLGRPHAHVPKGSQVDSQPNTLAMSQHTNSSSKCSVYAAHDRKPQV
jgi:hypothetical protein